MADVWVWLCDQPHNLGAPNFHGKCTGGAAYVKTWASTAGQPFAFDSAFAAIVIAAMVSLLATAWAIKQVRRVIR